MDNWVSIKDKKPPQDKPLLCYCFGNYVDIMRYKKGEWHDRDGSYRISLVSHWQPLPSPPKQ